MTLSWMQIQKTSSSNIAVSKKFPTSCWWAMLALARPVWHASLCMTNSNVNFYTFAHLWTQCILFYGLSQSYYAIRSSHFSCYCLVNVQVWTVNNQGLLRQINPIHEGQKHYRVALFFLLLWKALRVSYALPVLRPIS